MFNNKFVKFLPSPHIYRLNFNVISGKRFLKLALVMVSIVKFLLATIFNSNGSYVFQIQQIDQFTMDSLHSLNYFIDIGNSAVFNTPVSFTQKYPQLQHYQTIIEDQSKFQRLMFKMISSQHAENQEIDISGLIKEIGFSEESEGFISQVLKIKYAEYKRELIKRQLYQGSSFLANFNWKIKTVVGCSQFTHKNKILLKLQLIIGKGKKGDQLQPIALELGVPQARELLNKLKQISREMKNTNY